MENATNTIAETNRVEKFNIKDCKTTAEVLEFGNQIWQPAESKLFDQHGNEIKSHKAILRDDTNQALGVVGNGYVAMDLQESFEILDTLVGDQGLHFEELLMFDGGKRSILKVAMDDMILKENDIVKPMINIVQSFDGSKSYHIFFSMLRLICTNGMMGIGKESIMNIRHTKSMPDRVKLAETAMTNALGYFSNMKDISLKMISEKINMSYTDLILKELFGEDEKADGKVRTRTVNMKNKIIELFKSGIGNGGETKWDLLNGVTEYVDHHRSGTADNKTYSSEIGSGAKLKKRAFELLAA